MERRQSRRALLILVALFAVLAIHDFAVPPARAYGARATVAAIGEYQRFVSPHLRGRVFCRFTPTCSVYGKESVRKHGLLIGGAKAAWRVMRCGPWTRYGTVDPP